MEGISAKYVADSFVKQYYAVLNKCPESVYKFYKESSVLSWPGPDGVVTPVTTSSGINDKIVSSDYVKWFVETETVDAQDSAEGGIFVAVTGFLTGKDNARKNFFQTFFLAKQDNGFFVLNDILHIFDDYINDQAAAPFTQNSVPPFTINSSSKTEDALENGNVEEVIDISFSSDIAATVATSISSVDSLENLCSTPEPASDIKGDTQEMDQLPSSNTDNAVENGNVKEVINLPNSNDIAATVATSTSSVDSLENLGSTPEPASDIKGDAREMDQLASSNTENAVENGNVKEVIDLPNSNDTAATVTAAASSVDPQENLSSIPDPASDIKEDFASANTEDTIENGNIKDEIDASVSQETTAAIAAQKFSYASVVAKGRAGTSSTTARIPSNADNPAVPPLPAKVSATPSNADNQAVAPQTTKVSASVAAGLLKISPQPNNANPKLSVHSNGVTNSTSHAEAATTGIYIGRLPIDIDRQGILKVVTKFGQVKKGLDGIQIRRHEDGFCCGFVEFESADSARRAVEARRVNFGDRESYISYKKSSYRGSNGIGRSPSTGGFQNRNSKTRENSQISKRISNKQQSGDN